MPTILRLAAPTVLAAAAVCAMPAAAAPPAPKTAPKTAPGTAPAPSRQGPAVIDAVAGLNGFRLQDVAVPAALPDQLETTVELDGVARTLRLTRISLRGQDFRVLVSDAVTGLREVAAPPVRTYRGTVDGIPGSFVAATVHDGGRLTAQVVMPDRTTWTVQPLRDLADVAGAGDAHVVYRGDEVAEHGGRCGTPPPDPDDLPADVAPAPSGVAGTGLEICEIGFDCDFLYYAINQSSVANTVSDIETVMNAVAFIYERDVDITYEITTIVVRTSDALDPYTATTNPGSLLNQFDSRWSNAAFAEASINRDIAHLATGRNLDAPVIGLARSSSICSQSQGYSLSQLRFTSVFDVRVGLIAHELGHNWSACHCDEGFCTASPCNIMCSAINACNGLGAPQFAPSSQSDIIAFRNSRTCLLDLQDPLVPPFFEDFESGLPTTRWSYRSNNGINTSTGASNEPSGFASLQLDSLGSGTYQDEDIRSNFINLAGQAGQGWVLQYQTERIGVEAGEELIVQYRATGNDWIEVNRLTSDGVSQSEFECWEHLLPANAFHAEFRVRFSTDGNASNDDWYIDDVYVGPLVARCDDCNHNGLDDAAEIAGGQADDCDGNGAIDACDIAAGFAQDCNGNGTPDSCELAGGAADDCNDNGILDECEDLSGELDCDCDGAIDLCQLQGDPGLDADGNGVLDACQSSGDLDGDGATDVSDLLEVLGNWGPCEGFPGCPPACDGDANADCEVNVTDLLAVLGGWGSCQ